MSAIASEVNEDRLSSRMHTRDNVRTSRLRVSSQVFVYLTGMSECRPVHRTMLHNKNSNVRIKQYSNGISLECDEL